MENEYTQVMSQRTNQDLIKIVTVERDRYNPSAVEAAEAEIQQRGLDKSRFEDTIVEATLEREQMEDSDLNVVGSGTRFLNWLIDSVAYSILMTIALFTYTLFIPVNGSINDLVLVMMSLGIILSIFLLYHSIMEMEFQKTLGKFVTQTKVVKLNGRKPESADIIMRTFCRLIPFDRVSFLFTKNGIHDFLSKTKVVKDTAR